MKLFEGLKSYSDYYKTSKNTYHVFENEKYLFVQKQTGFCHFNNYARWRNAFRRNVKGIS